MFTRRVCLSAVAAAGIQWAAGPLARAQEAPSRSALPALPRLRIYIPAGTGGGWDQTGRALGSAMQGAGLVREIDYENKGGKGGTVGLADFVQRYRRDDSSLFVGGLVMVGAIALNRPAVSMKQLAPIARLTSDYMVLCVNAGGAIGSLQALVNELRRGVDRVAFTGGSAGGVDHMLAGMLLRALKLDPGGMKYLPTSSGKEAIAMLQAGQAQVAISGYSEFKPAIDDKLLLPLAVSSRKTLFGIASLREQGIDTELANWRGVFASAEVAPEPRDRLRRTVIRATESPAWRQTLLDNNWQGSLLYGRELDRFIAFEQDMVSLVTTMLKLKA